MLILSKKEVESQIDTIIAKIQSGAVFIHPTDTIYGLGCLASNEKAVAKIRKLKQRPDTPFSIWVPSVEWIKQNAVVDTKTIQKLPGPYTLIVILKKRDNIAKNVNPQGETQGIRYPYHWFGKIVAQIGQPIITTSVNKHAQPFMTSLEDLDPDIKKGVEFMIYEGKKVSKPSTIINVVEGSIKER